MWFLPSRRSHLVERVFSKSSPTEPGAIIVSVKDAPVYQKLRIPENWVVHPVANSAFYRDKVNSALLDFPDRPYYGIMSDDVVPETEGWDSFLAEQAGTKRLAFGSQVTIDRYGCGAIGGDLARACGWLCCPAVKHFYSDDVFELIGKEFDCMTWFKDVHLTHHHFSVSLSVYDTFYRTRSDQNDEAAYERWKVEEWPELKSRLRQLYH